MSDPNDDTPSAPGPHELAGTSGRRSSQASDPRDKEVALLRLRDAADDALAVFEGRLRDDALRAGATEQEIRDAQRNHPGHEA